jgi:tetratricopeptide (TPR) repeat protein
LRQLGRPTGKALTVANAHTEQVDVKPLGTSPIVLFGLMYLAAIAGGYLGTRLIHPPRYWIMVLCALGAASAAFLLAVVPSQTWLLLRKLAARMGLAMARGRLAAALAAIGARQAVQPEAAADPSALNDRAVVAYLRGAAASAESDLVKAREGRPQDPAILNNLGVVLARRRGYEDAAQALATAAATGLEEALANLGALAAVADAPEVVAHLTDALSASAPAAMFNNVGVLHLRLGGLDLASEYFTQAHRRDPRSPYPRANLGLVSFRRLRLREAARHLTAAAHAAPEDARIASDLGVVLAAAGKAHWARQQLDYAHDLDPTNIGVRLNHLACRAMDGEVEFALSALRSLSEAPYHRADVLYNLSVLELSRGEYEAGLHAVTAAIEAGEASADARTNLGVARWEARDRDGALAAFREAIAATDASAATYSNLGRALLLVGQPDEALKVLGTGRERWRSDPQLALDSGLAVLSSVAARYRPNMSAAERRDFYVELHRSFAGLDAAVRLREHAPLEARIGMGLYYHLREEWAEAAEQFELGLREEPAAHDLHYLVGTTYATWADHVRQQREDGSRVLTAEGLAHLRKAIGHLRTACESTEAAGEWFFNLARCLYGLEDYEGALSVLRKAPGFKDNASMSALAGLAAGNQARGWAESVRSQSLMPEAKKKAVTQHAQQFMDAAVQYFRQALHLTELNASLHGNLGLAYMLRNREHDVESALRHWQRMRAITGERAGRRYNEFTQIESMEHAARVRFDDTDVVCYEVDPAQWLGVSPPQMAGLHHILEPVAEVGDWRLVAQDGEVRHALQLRARISQRARALARLEAR